MSFVTIYVVSNPKAGVTNALLAGPDGKPPTIDFVHSMFQGFPAYENRWGDILAIRVSATIADEIYTAVVQTHYTKAATLMRTYAQSIQKVGDAT